MLLNSNVRRPCREQNGSTVEGVRPLKAVANEVSVVGGWEIARRVLCNSEMAVAWVVAGWRATGVRK